ncbi:hypothetical protein PsorP6_012569 [Peronosclerospora sorghi]|uniref:Uncharacterized protein n=1 Tax=Peronosclerospora sorghi TaxID=230839 RepID=A0ACC0WGT7_9STRA|nr:hypothetical protein PsorP6_012569 [Peronosclerospora sorghi]
MLQHKRVRVLSPDIPCGPRCSSVASDTRSSDETTGSTVWEKPWKGSEIALLNKLEHCLGPNPCILAALVGTRSCSDVADFVEHLPTMNYCDAVSTEKAESDVMESLVTVTSIFATEGPITSRFRAITTVLLVTRLSVPASVGTTSVRKRAAAPRIVPIGSQGATVKWVSVERRPVRAILPRGSAILILALRVARVNYPLSWPTKKASTKALHS